MNQFGASFGGPLAKNRAFFFGNYEGIRQHLGTTLLGNVPSASVRSQVLSTSPALSPIVNAFPTGQTHLDANTDLYTLQTVNTLREDAGMARFDYLFSNNTSALIRYSIDNVKSTTPDVTGAIDEITNRPQNLVLQLQHIVSPRRLRLQPSPASFATTWTPSATTLPRVFTDCAAPSIWATSRMSSRSLRTLL